MKLQGTLEIKNINLQCGAGLVDKLFKVGDIYPDSRRKCKREQLKKVPQVTYEIFIEAKPQYNIPLGYTVLIDRVLFVTTRIDSITGVMTFQNANLVSERLELFSCNKYAILHMPKSEGSTAPEGMDI